jgi:probable HAF family extracellular repeat protein
MSMASTARTHLRRRLGVLIAGAAVLTTLMTVTAAASMPPVEAPPGLARPGTTASITRTSSPSSTRPRTPIPGFLLDRGRVTKFDAPTAVTETGPNSINNRGQIVGGYKEAGNATHGFLRDRAGRFTTIDVPGAKGTGIYRINDRGQLVGRYSQTHADIQDPNSIARGFLLDRGRLTRIDVPRAAETQAVGLNNHGQVVGEYQNPDGTFHGFLWHRGRLSPSTSPAPPPPR